jgi:hypothetical protein
MSISSHIILVYVLLFYSRISVNDSLSLSYVLLRTVVDTFLGDQYQKGLLRSRWPILSPNTVTAAGPLPVEFHIHSDPFLSHTFSSTLPCVILESPNNHVVPWT